MNKMCPICREQISESTARISAGLTLILLVGIFFFPTFWIPLILVIDFALKGFFKKPSLTKTSAQKISKILHLKNKMVNAGPKNFALKIGFWMSLGLLVFALLGWTVVLFVFTGIFALAVGMEAFFNFCLGCAVFPYWKKLF